MKNSVRLFCIVGFYLTPHAFFATFSTAAPITFNTALPIAKDEGILRVQTKYIRSTDDPSPMNRKLEMWAFPIVGVYGLTENIAVFGVVPVLDKSLTLTTPVGRRTRGDSGLGDITFITRYIAHQKDHPGKTFRIAPFIGLEMPTGDNNETDSLGALPHSLQLGSGSWDPFIGVVGTWQELSHQIDVSLLYKFNTKANNFEFGDEIKFDTSYQHRLWPRNIEGGIPHFIYAVLESNIAWRERNEISGKQDNHSGGTTWHLSPGIQYVTKRFIAEVAIQLPVMQNLNGSSLKNDLITTMSVRVNF